MVSIFLISQNTREEQILKMAFEQSGIKVVTSKPNFQSYVLISQYNPDLIFIELPHLCSVQLEFTARIRGYKRSTSLPIIGYGDRTDDMVKRGILKQGVTLYIERPLKFSAILKLVEKILNKSNKKLEPKQNTTDKAHDIDIILSSDAPPSQKIEVMIRHVSALLAFPFTVAKVLQITQDDKSGAGHLAHAIGADPAMTTHLLKVANSVFFASSNRRINSIQDSIVRIGFMETKKIVMSMTVMKVFDQKNKNFGFDRIDFWYHSLAVGLISERIAKFIGDVNLEEAFLAGLLHDLGVIILDEFLPTIFNRVLEETAKNGHQFIQTQLTMLKVSHNDLIAGLFPIWKIPQDITDAIILQETISDYQNALDTMGKKIALCVAIANIAAKVLHIGRECDEYIKQLPNWLFTKAKLPYGLQADFVDHINTNLEIFRNFLGLEKREYTTHSIIEKPEDICIGIANPAGIIFTPSALFLRKNKFRIENIEIVDSVSTYDKKFNIIITLIDSSISASKIKPLSRIVAPEKQNTISTVLRFTPVLVIGPEDYDINSLPSQFHFLPDNHDLRIFDLKINEIISREGEEKK